MRRRSSRVLTGLLVACLGIGSLANGYQAKAVSTNRGYQDDVATYGFQVASHPGTKVYLNSELKGYVLDTWCYINSRWSHEWVTANGGVTSTDDCPVELKLGEDNHRNYVYPERITDLPEEFSVVIKEYYQGRQVKTFTEYSTEYDISKEYPSEGKYDEDYYKMLDNLREADQKKEVERLKELEEQEENKLNLAQKYLNKELNAIEKQIDAQKEEKEAAGWET